MDCLLRPLRRKTLSTHYLPEIDGLRFVAILAVLVIHLSDDLTLRHGVVVVQSEYWLVNLFSHGDRGVPLFFSISGFILAIPFAKRYFAVGQSPDLKRYFFRRLTRLEPPYLLNVVLCAIGTWAVNKSLRPDIVPHLLAALTYTHGLIFHYHNPINVVWWSLEIETQFYFSMPLLALLFKIRNPFVRRMAWIAGIFFLTALQHFDHSWVINSTIVGSLQYFLSGILVADLYQSGTMRGGNQTLWTCGGITALAMLFVLPDWWKTCAPVLLFLILAGGISGNAFRQVLSYPWFAAIGGMCYTIYLWHLFVLALVLRLTARLLMPRSFLLNFVTQFILIVPVILAVCVGLFLLIEKPCMEPDWPARLRAHLAGARSTVL